MFRFELDNVFSKKSVRLEVLKIHYYLDELNVVYLLPQLNNYPYDISFRHDKTLAIRWNKFKFS